MPEIVETPSQWTNGGTEVVIVKCVPKDGRVSGTDGNDKPYNFTWPLIVGAIAEAPDWNAEPKCGGGLHGWPWGLFLGDGKDPDWNAVWLVFSALPADIVDLGGKCKCRQATIKHVGSWDSALDYVLSGQMAYVFQKSRGAASSTGYQGAAVVTGGEGEARGGQYGCIALAWFNKNYNRYEMRCAEVGSGDGSDGKLKANTWYELSASGEFVEMTVPA